MVPSPFSGTPARAGNAAATTSPIANDLMQSLRAVLLRARAAGAQERLERGEPAQRLQIIVAAGVRRKISVELDGGAEVLDGAAVVAEPGQRTGVVVLRLRQVGSADDQLRQRVRRALHLVLGELHDADRAERQLALLRRELVIRLERGEPVRQGARVRFGSHLEAGHERAEVRFGEARVPLGEGFETVERGGWLASLEESHAGEEIDLALPLRREGQDLEATRARLEDAVAERLALRTRYLEQQAIRTTRVERPAVADWSAGGSTGEEPDGRRRVADRVLAGTIGLRRDVLSAAPRLWIVLVAALAHGLEPIARGIPARRGRRLLRQGEGGDLHLHSGGDPRVAVVGYLPAARTG